MPLIKSCSANSTNLPEPPTGTPSQIVVKQDRGPGGLLDLLRAASPVAPDVLPDIIALDNSDLETAARSGLIQPIGPLLSAGCDRRSLSLRARSRIVQRRTVWRGVQRRSGAPGHEQHHASAADLGRFVEDAAPLSLSRWAPATPSATPCWPIISRPEAGSPTKRAIPCSTRVALRTLLETYQTAREAGVLPGNFSRTG